MDGFTSDYAAGCSVVGLVAWSMGCRCIMASITLGVIFFVSMDIVHNQNSDVVEEVCGTVLTRMFGNFRIAWYVASIDINKICASEYDVAMIVFSSHATASVFDVSDVYFVFSSNVACKFVDCPFVFIMCQFANESAFSLWQDLLQGSFIEAYFRFFALF